MMVGKLLSFWVFSGVMLNFQGGTVLRFACSTYLPSSFADLILLEEGCLMVRLPIIDRYIINPPQKLQLIWLNLENSPISNLLKSACFRRNHNLGWHDVTHVNTTTQRQQAWCSAFSQHGMRSATVQNERVFQHLWRKKMQWKLNGTALVCRHAPSRNPIPLRFRTSKGTAIIKYLSTKAIICCENAKRVATSFRMG